MTLAPRKETFDSIEEQWRTLVDESPSASVFSTPVWLRAWWENCSSSEELMLLSFRSEAGVAGIAPLMASENTLRFMAYSDVCDYHDFLVQSGGEEPFFQSLVDLFAEGPWASIELDGLAEDSPTLHWLPSLARERGFDVERSAEEVSPQIPVASTWEDYLGSLGKKDRHELRRKFRRLEAAGQASYYAVGSGELTGDVSIFLDLLRSSREDKAAFLNADRERFFHGLATAVAAEGLLKLFFLELDGVRVAGSLCFDFNGAYYLYNSGYDRDYAALSVGLLLKAACLRDAIERKKGRFDLLRGPETYKYHLGAKDHWLYKLVIRRAGTR